MDDLVRDIQETLAAYRKRGQKKICPLTGQAYIGVKFFDRAVREYNEIRVTDSDFSQPAVDFEKAYNLRGISHRYCLPKGLSAADLEIYVALLRHRNDISEGQRRDKLTEIWAALAARNPVLKNMEYASEDTATLSRMVMGVTSAFNVDDIQYFISAPDDAAQKAWKSSAYKTLAKIFNRHSPQRELDIKWIPSPTTLRLIRSQILARGRQPMPGPSVS